MRVCRLVDCWFMIRPSAIFNFARPSACFGSTYFSIYGLHPPAQSALRMSGLARPAGAGTTASVRPASIPSEIWATQAQIVASIESRSTGTFGAMFTTSSRTLPSLQRRSPSPHRTSEELRHRQETQKGAVLAPGSSSRVDGSCIRRNACSPAQAAGRGTGMMF